MQAFYLFTGLLFVSCFLFGCVDSNSFVDSVKATCGLNSSVLNETPQPGVTDQMVLDNQRVNGSKSCSE